jgi:peroxiredoxin
MKKSMLRRILVCAFAALFTLTAAHAREPRAAAQIPIPLPDGKKITLQQYRGKVVLLAIFSTMCGDCVDNMEMLNRVQKELGPKGFQAIGGAGDEDAQYTVSGFVQRYKIGFPVGYLTKDQMIALADIAPGRRPVAPIFLFIDKRGIVRFQYYGDDSFFKTSERATRLTVEGLLKEQVK